MSSARGFVWGTVAVLLVVGCGPIAFVPGVRIGGAEADVPVSWAQIEIPEEVQLRAGGGWIPRVVNIWAVQAGGTLYVSGDPDSGWVTRLLLEPDTDVRVGDSVYAMRAEPVQAAAEGRTVRNAYMRKYGDEIRAFAADAGVAVDEFASDNVLFRLKPR